MIGDKRMGGYLWLRAMKRFTGKLYSVQIDPNEIPGHRGDGHRQSEVAGRRARDRSTTR